jgi:hypothetical protein
MATFNPLSMNSMRKSTISLIKLKTALKNALIHTVLDTLVLKADGR